MGKTLTIKKAASRRNSKQKNGLGVSKSELRYIFRSSLNKRCSTFNLEIKQMLHVRKGQARCHLISWKNIHDNVYKICKYTCMYERMENWFFANMVKLWYAVTGELKPSDKYLQSLYKFMSVDREFKSKAMQEIIEILNNQPNNLRLGASGTNSSIGSALDLPTGAVESAWLPAGTLYTEVWREPDGSFKECHTFEEDKKVILITNQDVAKRLMAFLDIETSVEFSIYTTGDTVQSSDNPGMNRGEKLAEGAPIGFYVGEEFVKKPLYYLFTPNK